LEGPGCGDSSLLVEVGFVVEAGMLVAEEWEEEGWEVLPEVLLVSEGATAILEAGSGRSPGTAATAAGTAATTTGTAAVGTAADTTGTACT